AFLAPLPLPARSTLFPYTTLFRSLRRTRAGRTLAARAGWRTGRQPPAACRSARARGAGRGARRAGGRSAARPGRRADPALRLRREPGRVNGAALAGWRLLLTRPQEDCLALAQDLAEQGAYGSCLPLLEIEPLPE